MEKLLQRILDELLKRHVDTARLVTTTSIVHKGPALIGGIVITGAGGAANAQIYDGENTNGRQLANLYALNGTSFNWNIADHVDVDNGIYIVIGTGTTKVTIHYHPESYKKFV